MSATNNILRVMERLNVDSEKIDNIISDIEEELKIKGKSIDKHDDYQLNTDSDIILLDTFRKLRSYFKIPTVEIPYRKVNSPEIAYLLGSDFQVRPCYSESDGYGTVHVWIEDGKYYAGVEIERRYLSLDDKLYPKIREYVDVPESVLKVITTLPKI